MKLRMIKTLQVIFILLLICFSSFGCSGDQEPGSEENAPVGITATISTDKPIPVAEGEATAAKSTIAISNPDGPLDGMEINIPPNAYSSATQFSVSYSLVKKHTFGESFNPISPIITVDNGEVLADIPIEVTIPVTVPEGHFAMGFLYDEEIGQLEGLPLVSSNAGSITVATRHFSDIVVSSVDPNDLSGDIDSNFRPGVDDWQFANYGSYIAQGGHCSGQSMTAMFYYISKPDGPNASLYGRYDNNAHAPATPDFWFDDSLGYRFASVIQQEENWGSEDRITTYDLSTDPEKTWYLFAYTMKMTKHPQMVEISNGGSAHAMVIYRVNAGKLYVADPNYPGDANRSIEYSNGKFTPYNSGANADAIAAGLGEEYDRIVFVGKSALVDWKKMHERWAQVKAGTAGDDFFPSYEIKTIDKDNNTYPLVDGYETSEKILPLSLISNLNSQAAYYVYRDQQKIARQGKGYELVPGENNIGIMVVGMSPESKWKYIDFKHFKIIYNEPPEETPIVTPTAPAAAERRWKLVETVLPNLPEMPVKFRDQFGSHSMTLSVTDNKIIYDVRTTANGVETGVSVLTLTMNGVPDTVTLGEEIEITGNWDLTVSGEPRVTSSALELRKGDFQGVSRRITLEQNPSGSLPFTWSPAGGRFEVTARLSVHGDQGRIRWVYQEE